MDYSFIPYAVGIFLLILGFIIYFLPALMGGGKENGAAILLLNLILGWTVIGWVACFIWACVSPDRTSKNPFEATPQTLETAQARSSRNFGAFLSMILNFILTGLLLIYLIHPSIVLRNRYSAISLYERTFHTK